MKYQHLLSVGALLVVGNIASAQNREPVIITVDENGHGTIEFPSSRPGFILNSFLAADPGPGGLSSVLTYDLGGPPSLVAGDVLLTDADFNNFALDIIRFNAANPATGTPAAIVFYSDNVGGSDSLADTTGPPSKLYSNQVSIPEIGSENSNGATYTPGANDPGFIAGYALTYNFISDAVPEPGALALLLGTVSLPLLALRRQRSRR